MDAKIEAMTDDKWAEELADSLRDLRSDTAVEVDKMRDFHRNAASTYARRIENARKHCRNELAELEDEQYRLEQKFEADMRRIDAERSAIKAAADHEIATAAKLAAASKSALEALTA
ncbi:MAG: hypothetical protein WA975_21595 [Mesorhizobium sp.]